jgi:nucleoside 2-deoxyribosyltransferase
MKVIYIAGPFRADNAWEIEQNIRRAECLALEVWKAGAAAICPHTNTRFFQGVALDEVWLKGDIEIMRRCDAVLLTANWEISSGARAERKEAKALGIPVFACKPTSHGFRELPPMEFLDWLTFGENAGTN